MTALTALALAGPPKPETGFGFPHDASIDGHLIDWLINATSVFVGILFVITCVWMLYAALKHGPKHQAEYDLGNSKHSVTIALAISAVIFFVVDGNLFVNSMVDLNKAFWNHADAEAMGSVVRIEVNAHQWAWDARYAGPDNQFGTQDDVVTLNDIRVPADTPILIQLQAVDVIHSFYLPNFRVKQDAMPGMTNRLWFRAKKEEVGQQYDIACAQHCGTNHYKMKGTLTVLSKEDYARWLKDQSAVSSRAYDPNDTDAHWGWKWKEI